MNIIILCGGLSSRLGDITKSVPKILLDIGGKTVLDWQLDMVRSLGVTDIVFAAGHLSDVLHKTIGNERQGYTMVYAIESKKLGTGGAIKNALAHVARPQEPTLILNGDILAHIDIRDMVRSLRPDSEGIILGAKVDNASSYGTLEYDDQKHLLQFKEKEGIERPGYINGGIYLFTPLAQKHFPSEDAFSIEYDVFPHMKDLDVYESDEPWIDVGVPERLAWAREHWTPLSSIV